jgi:hypothetical protein
VLSKIRFWFYTTFGVTKKNVKHIKIQLFKFFECSIRINVRFSEVFKNIYLVLSPRRIFKLCIFLPIFVLLDLMRGRDPCQKKKKKKFFPPFYTLVKHNRPEGT